MGKGAKKSTKKFNARQKTGNGVKKGPRMGFKQRNKQNRGQDVLKASGALSLLCIYSCK